MLFFPKILQEPLGFHLIFLSSTPPWSKSRTEARCCHGAGLSALPPVHDGKTPSRPCRGESAASAPEDCFFILAAPNKWDLTGAARGQRGAFHIWPLNANGWHYLWVRIPLVHVHNPTSPPATRHELRFHRPSTSSDTFNTSIIIGDNVPLGLCNLTEKKIWISGRY